LVIEAKRVRDHGIVTEKKKYWELLEIFVCCPSVWRKRRVWGHVKVSYTYDHVLGSTIKRFPSWSGALFCYVMHCIYGR
jgi:hypothetical protein